ncbi:MAG: hypothetical protein BWY82_00740 [Verrucomicrobia bacterium ADurb.Bin474]|nr:MAG: hypothetical protein BWY82_00740 [Verrucomicrobia bacterium ADurb.Bin474]
MPRLAPITTPTACGNVKSPALTNPITATVVALDDCTINVTTHPDKNAFSGLPVNFTNARRNASPANDFSPSVSNTIPSKNKPTPPVNLNKSAVISQICPPHLIMQSGLAIIT